MLVLEVNHHGARIIDIPALLSKWTGQGQEPGIT
jgi:hypothetical protein